MDEDYKVSGLQDTQKNKYSLFSLSGAVIFSLIMISLVLMCIISACVAKLQRTRSKKYAPEHSYGTYPKGEKPYLKDLQFINEKYAKKAWYLLVFPYPTLKTLNTLKKRHHTTK